MKNMYYENVMKRVREELKINNSMLSLDVAGTGDSITADGIEFFKSITSVCVKSHGVVIAVYDIESKRLRYYPYIKNIVVVKDLVDFLNNYNGYEKYTLNKRAEKRLFMLECSRDEIDPECSLSDYEIADIMSMSY